MLKIFFPILILLFLASCTKQEERFNYTMIKGKLDLTKEQTTKFDKITAEYLTKARKNFEEHRGNKEVGLQKLQEIFDQQDEELAKLLTPQQFEIYAHEIKIEREGREKYNMRLIKAELKLDSLQSKDFDLANNAFYTTLIDNHDNYHGKPDVYFQYYKELDKSRQAVFEKIMSPEQYNKYLQLAKKYELGMSEH